MQSQNKMNLIGINKKFLSKFIIYTQDKCFTNHWIIDFNLSRLKILLSIID